MPGHADELQDGGPSPVKPETDEYEAFSFLVAHRKYGVTPKEIVDGTTLSEPSASKIVARLFDKRLVERSQGVYYVAPGLAEDLKHRLDSNDAAARLHQTIPYNDPYAEAGWEEEVSSIDPDGGRRTDETDDGSDTADEAQELVARLTDEDQGRGGK